MSKVTISAVRLKYLESRDEILSALEAGGVDNWEWYSESLQEAGLLDEDDEDDEEEDDE
ncbi:host RecBCD nuclease inhibitor [Klebsiella phage Speegle]|nr:host RecBCD nuclease inhibitor [Klebsiella phage Speegle]